MRTRKRERGERRELPDSSSADDSDKGPAVLTRMDRIGRMKCPVGWAWKSAGWNAAKRPSLPSRIPRPTYGSISSCLSCPSLLKLPGLCRNHLRHLRMNCRAVRGFNPAVLSAFIRGFKRRQRPQILRAHARRFRRRHDPRQCLVDGDGAVVADAGQSGEDGVPERSVQRQPDPSNCFLPGLVAGRDPGG
jgi:hypothetical protein